MISSIITMAGPPTALVFSFLATQQPKGRWLAILAIVLSGIETLTLLLLFQTTW